MKSSSIATPVFGVETTLEDVILNLQPHQRQIVAEVREQNMMMRRQVSELEAEVNFLKQRNVELDNSIRALEIPRVSVPAPVMSLQDLISGLKQQSAQEIEMIRHKATESLQSMDDPSFDAYLALQQSVSRSIKPNPKNFEFVDLVGLKESLQQEGHTPTSPIQIPLIREFVSHIDGVRQCTKDGRFAHIYYDPVKLDVMRRLFDTCKAVESRLGSTAHLVLPPQTVAFDPSDHKGDDVVLLRQREMQSHVTSITQCGVVFERATTDVQQLDDAYNAAQTLPHMLSEFESVIQAMSNEMENLQQNEIVIKEGGNTHVENLRAHRLSLQDQSDTMNAQITAKQREIDRYFEEMMALLQKAEDGFRAVSNMVSQSCKVITEIALCDHRIAEIRKTVEQEVQKQQRYYEGAKFTTFLANKARDLFRRMYNNLEESMRSRRELCERTRVSAQEQLYTMAENLHDILSKRLNADTQSLKNDQSALDAANRSLMSLVHNPKEMERSMEHIRQLTLSIAATKSRISQTSVDLQEIRHLVGAHNTIQFLRRDTNFLTIFESVEKSSKMKDRIEDIIQRVKFVSEVLVEVSDPDTRQDFIVEQCLEALKQTVGEVGDILSARSQVEDLEESFRVPASTKLKRHRRLIAHFLEEMRDGTNDLKAKEPNVEIHTVALLDGVDVVIAALTHNEEPIPQHLKARFSQSSMTMMSPYAMAIGPTGITQTSSLQPGFQHHGDSSLMGPGGPEGSVAPATADASHVGSTFGAASASAASLSRGTFGGVGRGAFNTNASPTGMPNFLEADQPIHTFARYSERLRITNDGAKLTKVPAGMEISNTSALGGIGFRLASGIHYYTIRMGANCGRLLVGFADWNLPLDGYCNSLKYSGCYYLHVGNGTLWAPELRMERTPYTYEALAEPGGELRCMIDTNERTISFVYKDTNLGVAFRNINLSRTLYPAFEVFSNSCSIEFVNPVQDKASPQRR